MADIKQQFLSVTVGRENLVNTHARAKAVIAGKRAFLDGPIPFQFRDEMDVHHSVLDFANAAVSQISVLKNMLGLSTQKFPEEHKLIREFRNHNHHVGYKGFMPVHIASEKTIDFYVWPILCHDEYFKEKFPKWCSEPSKLLLIDLLDANLSYVQSLTDSCMHPFEDNPLKISDSQKIQIMSHWSK